MHILNELLSSNGFAVDCETTSDSGKRADNTHFKRCKLVCVSFYNEAFSKCLTVEEINAEWETFKELMTNPKYKKVGHNLKFDAKVITEWLGFKVQGLWFDTSIASKLLNENESHGLKDLGKKYLKREWGEWKNFKTWLKDKDLKMGKLEAWELESLDVEYLTELKEYCREDSKATWDLAKVFKPKLRTERVEDLFSTEMEVVRVFYEAELNGVTLDLPYLEQLINKYTERVNKIEQCIHIRYKRTQIENRAAGCLEEIKDSFNINSPAQLGEVLYKVFGLPQLKKTKKGNISTDTRTLTELARLGHKLPKRILWYRHWEMLRRHIEKLIKEQIDGRIYPTFNTIGTETGRFSCKEPNLQQIPSKTVESRKIRKAFTGNLIVADYGNVELRLLAHYTRDPKLLRVYREGNGDLHAETARHLGVTRSIAKTINFGISYGMGARKLAEDLNIDEVKAQGFITQWYDTYSKVKPWKNMIINTVKKYGFIRSIGGRKRRISFKGLSKYDCFGAEREAVNFVIQGSSADITKLAIKDLKSEKILLQVHDELVIEKGSLSGVEVGQIMSSIGEQLGLLVSLEVDAKECKTWAEMK